ncbi:MAG: Uma2 family endonuclease [Bryobacteraceae bacterium]
MGTTATKLTVEDFLATPEREDVRQELIDGEIVEMSRGGPLHETVKANVMIRLAFYFLSNRLSGKVFSETMYQLSEHDASMPDVSVVLSGKLDPHGTGKTSVAPDLVVEVVSSESAARLQEKVSLYINRGVRAVWVAYPTLRVVDVYKGGGVRRLTAEQNQEDGDSLPGFSVQVGAFFE